MRILKSKTMATAFSVFLMFAIAVSIVASPFAYAWDADTQAAIDAGMTWDFPGSENYDASSSRLLMWERYGDQVPTWTYGVLSPNPVGVGQEMTIVMFNPQVPHASADANDVRYEYSVDIHVPDGSSLRIPSSGTIVSDSTGTAYTTFTPSMEGNYTINITFQELFYRWYQSGSMREFYGVTLLESNRTYTLVVQQEQVEPTAVTVYPLPTEFWTRPIEGQNNAWGAVSSYWLNNAHERDYGSGQNRYQREGLAPNSPHILWTKVTEDGGVVGGDEYFSTEGEVFNAGHQYQTRFTNQIIMMGRLYYEVPLTFSGGGGGWMCVDLKTGEDLWGGPKDFGTTIIQFGPWTFVSSISPSFGYYYDWDNMNQHGIVNPSWLFTNNFGMSIHPRYGTLGQLNLTDVPSGTTVIGPKGENLRYRIENAGTSSNPDYRLLQWNSSKVFTSNLGEIDASDPDSFDWNVSIPICNTLTGSRTIRAVIYDDVLLGSNGSLPTAGTGSLDYDNPEEGTLWAVSLKPESRGQTLFGPTNYKMTFDDGTQNIFIRAGEGVFIMQHMPDLTFSGYSMYTGEKLWEGESQAEQTVPFGYYTWVSLMNVFGHSIADGKFYTAGYTGHVFCYDLQTGELLWLYEAPTNARIFEYYTLFLGSIADGKVYVGTHEHSADTPLYKGNRIRCLNATTGEEIWTMLGWAHPQTMAVADGVLVYWNNYDHQVYAVGKGPSATTVTAPDISVAYGKSVLVKGTVTDVSAGTKQAEQAARFPNGVPAVSDESMGDWMEYVYMQKPKPTDVTGVEVVITVLDPNNNSYEVARTTSDASGFFSAEFVPEVPGKYTVVATFAGSESYWQSHAETALLVEEEVQPTPAPTPVPQEPVGTYFTVSTVAIIAAIAIVAFLLLRRR
ncbi:MAG: PQQ-binding-like beta-propeller repeat protein [Candidatus Bathyarchaeota archaeon]|nr:PQQ-binding-like beta-propeller repeat protein [Candidatus Bathyarchaeota archaeon]